MVKEKIYDFYLLNMGIFLFLFFAYPTTKSLLKLPEDALKLNNFMFNGERYIHKSETAMGTKMAPSYANIFMRRLNETCSLELLANF